MKGQQHRGKRAIALTAGISCFTLFLGLLLGMAMSAWHMQQTMAFIALLLSVMVYPLGIVVLLIRYRRALRHKNTGRPASQETDAGGDISQSAVERFRAQQLAHFACEHRLTRRETDVCGYLARGHSVKTIAEDLCISENTVWTHIRSVYSKCAVNTKQDLIRLFDGQA